jgi:long-chain fatty acid transport protein
MQTRNPSLLAAALLLAPAAFAGSVDNRNNNSAEYIRNVSRNAATEGADVSIYNPAGAVRLEDGLHLSLANQTVAKFNEHRLANNKAVAYESDILSPVYPTAFATYKKGDWAAFAAFYFPGGGGELEYEKGSATTFLIQTNLQVMGLNADAYLRSLYYGFVVGGSYAVKPWLALSLAGRAIYARTDITVDAGKDFPPANSSLILDHMEEARGYTGILGIDFFHKDLTLAVRYEGITPLTWEVTKSNLNMENVIKDNTTRAGYTARLRNVLRAPGSEFERDLPAVLSLGAGYKALGCLNASLSMNVYFNATADWSGADTLHENGMEYAAGVEYAAAKIPLKASVSGMYTISGADQKSYSVENPALDSYTIGLGGRYGIGQRFGVTLGWAGNFTFEDKADFALLNTTADLKKRVLVYALGFDYRFF